jgi:hypothetical protein
MDYLKNLLKESATTAGAANSVGDAISDSPEFQGQQQASAGGGRDKEESRTT